MATRDEVYAKFGVTAEAAQLFETSLGSCVLGAKALVQGWPVTPDKEAAAKAFQKIDDSTLGDMIKAFKNHVEIDETIINQFSSALKARNRLIHGFYVRHNFKIANDAGRDEMIADLDALHDTLFLAWRIADDLAEEFWQEFLRQRNGGVLPTPPPLP